MGTLKLFSAAKRIAPLLLLLTVTTGIPARMLFGQEMSEGRARFYRLEELYMKWHEGLFGSRSYYGRELYGYLAGLVGREIETGQDCRLVSPEGVFDGLVECPLGGLKWLTLRGGIDGESLKEAVSGKKDMLKSWWRSGFLVSVSGKVRRFSIDTAHRDGGITIYLDRISFHGGGADKE